MFSIRMVLVINCNSFYFSIRNLKSFSNFIISPPAGWIGSNPCELIHNHPCWPCLFLPILWICRSCLLSLGEDRCPWETGEKEENFSRTKESNTSWANPWTVCYGHKGRLTYYLVIFVSLNYWCFGNARRFVLPHYPLPCKKWHPTQGLAFTSHGQVRYHLR